MRLIGTSTEHYNLVSVMGVALVLLMVELVRIGRIEPKVPALDFTLVAVAIFLLDVAVFWLGQACQVDDGGDENER